MAAAQAAQFSQASRQQALPRHPSRWPERYRPETRHSRSGQPGPPAAPRDARGDNPQTLAGHRPALGLGQWPQREGGIPQGLPVLFRREANQLVSPLSHRHPKEMQVNGRAARPIEVGGQEGRKTAAGLSEVARRWISLSRVWVIGCESKMLKRRSFPVWLATSQSRRWRMSASAVG